MKRKKLILIAAALSLILLVIFWRTHRAEAPKSYTSDNHTTAPATQFNKSQYSIDDPSSIWVIVNKKRSLVPKTYAPGDLVTPAIPLRSGSGNGEMKLRKETASALQTMSSAAKAQGLNFMLASGYRSYGLQVSVYGAEVRNYGLATADSESARPGFSEHQTGFAADLEPASRKCEVQNCFANTLEGQWLAAHAFEYGFILRYLPDKVQITGYRYEPWHVRYVGTALSTEMHKQGITTLEEFFGQPAAPNY